MNDSPMILRLQNITKCFSTPQGEQKVLHEVNMILSQGEFIIVTGPSGSGKTTFLHLAALLDLPTSGKIFFEGNDISTLDEKEINSIRKKSIGMVFQNYHLLTARTVLENVMFRFRYLDYNPSETESLAVQALETVGLSHIMTRPARLLSAGEMQRVAVARAIALKPKLLVADEPTGNLDKITTSTVMDCFQRLNQSGITILMVTHNEALLNFSTRHLKCRDGGILN